MKTMTLDGVRYVEVKGPFGASRSRFGDCIRCDLISTKKCGQAIDGAAATSFGGDCEQRGVIYKQVDE